MSDLYAYIDESGIFQKLKNPNHRYFIICITLTEHPTQLARVFKRSLLKTIKGTSKLEDILKSNKEVKGSELPEIKKTNIYTDIIKSTIVSEYGVIVVDTLQIEDKFKENAARAFNYLLKLFLINYRKSKNGFPMCTKVKLFIDERNITTKSIHTLKEYLNTELVMADSIFTEDFEVNYCDSKNQPLIQLSDYIANTALRYYHTINDHIS